MKIKQQTLETMKIVGLVVFLTGLLFAITAWAQAQETESAAEAEITAEQDARDSRIGASPNAGKEARQQRKALRNARRQELREYTRQQRAAKLAASQNQAAPASVARPAAPLKDIQVSLKVDTRLTRSLYMGDRWVFAPTYVGTVGQDTVEARVKGVDARGVATGVSPKWISADPEMVTVTPSEGNEVKIIVKRAGESSLRVTSQDVSKELSIKAAQHGNTMQVQITQ